MDLSCCSNPEILTSRWVVGKKAGEKANKKVEQTKKKIVEDKTFGMKNKNKSKAVQVRFPGKNLLPAFDGTHWLTLHLLVVAIRSTN